MASNQKINGIQVYAKLLLSNQMLFPNNRFLVEKILKNNFPHPSTILRAGIGSLPLYAFYNYISHKRRSNDFPILMEEVAQLFFLGGHRFSFGDLANLFETVYLTLRLFSASLKDEVIDILEGYSKYGFSFHTSEVKTKNKRLVIGKPGILLVRDGKCTSGYPKDMQYFYNFLLESLLFEIIKYQEHKQTKKGNGVMEIQDFIGLIFDNCNGLITSQRAKHMLISKMGVKNFIHHQAEENSVLIDLTPHYFFEDILLQVIPSAKNRHSIVAKEIGALFMENQKLAYQQLAQYLLNY